MPIFQDDIHHESPASSPIAIEPAPSRSRRLSEESLRTELCEGPVPDSPMHSSTTKGDEENRISDRAELIERLKRGESPTWVPNRHLESILQHENSHSAQEQGRTSPESPNLLPPAPITPDRTRLPESADARLRDGLSIERPRSAFHSGDFTSDVTASENGQHNDPGRPGAQGRMTSEHAWFATSPPRHFTPFRYGVRAHGRRTHPLDTDVTDGFKSDTSPLSTSLSSFAYQPPTSPLAQSETNEDVDFSTPPEFPSMKYKSTWRHQLNSNHSSPFHPPSSRSRPQSRFPPRREGALPYQAHQPRRSLTSTPTFTNSHHPFSSPQTPALLRSRRQSFGPDTSPIQHASMVGSYEESILRGRMSTTPSKPFEFVAQIGVMGKGNCKSSLRCPRHVTLPFPAVYYSYGGAPHGRSLLDDGPSPYVGQIDLENGLSNPEEESRSRRKAQSRYSDRKQQASSETAGLSVQETEADRERQKAAKSKRLPASPRAPPGGSYRIPETGQIQIVIKNPNKTAVKLFLVPYDLTGMMPGTKTFIRQRSYSAGPIIDNVPNMSQVDGDRPILRYLVHLHICSPAKGRFYLYKSIRIVFANRVPDGKEKLRNETTLPEPRFSPYKPIRVMNPPLSTSSGAGAMLASEKALRRRSLGIFMSGNTSGFDGTDGLASPEEMPMTAPSPSSGRGSVTPMELIPLRLPQQPDTTGNESNGGSDGAVVEHTSLNGSSSLANSRPFTKDSGGVDTWGPSQYEKLNRGDAGYGGNAFSRSASSSSPGNAPEGLLSQRLRGLGVKPQQTD